MALWLLALGIGCAGVDPYQGAVERGNVALSVGEVEDAADAFRAALASRPGDPAALHGLARSHLARGQGERALEAFAQIEASDPIYFRERAAVDYRAALYRVSMSRLERGDSAGALRLLRRLRAEEGPSAGLDELWTRALVMESGRLYVADRRLESAALLREALGAAAEGPDGALLLAERLMELGRVDTAISVLSDAQRRHPDDRRLDRLMDRALEIRYPDGLPR